MVLSVAVRFLVSAPADPAKEYTDPSQSADVSSSRLWAPAGRVHLIIIAVVLARLAQHPGASSDVPAWVIAATLGAIALAAVAVHVPRPGTDLRAGRRTEHRSTITAAACLLVLSTVVALAIWSREPFATTHQFVNNSSSWAAVIWVAGMVVSLGMLWRDRPVRRVWRGLRHIDWTRHYLETLALLLIVDVATGLRVWHLASLPEGVWFDEADFAASSQRLYSLPFQPLGPGEVGHIPSLYFYIMAGVMKVAGTSMGGVRLTSALFGILAVVAVYAIGRRSLGPAYGLCAAALLAISKWAIDFSRLGMSQIAAPAMVSCGMAFFCVSMSIPSGFWFGLSGVMLGLSVLSYQGAFIVGSGVALLTVAIRTLCDARFRAAMWPSVLLLPLGMIAGVAPLLIAVYLDRTFTLDRESTVSLFNQYPEWPDRISNLLSNIRLHALMFTVQGDSNGRHNLPGSPMLDSVSGSLFLLGLGMCTRRIGNWFYQLLLLWLATSLLGGILSLSFEAPQGARTIGAIAPIALIAALPLAMFATWIGQLVRDLLPGAIRMARARHEYWAPVQCVAAAVVLLIPLGVALHDNYDDYFVKQASSIGPWLEMGGLESITGRTAVELQRQGYSVRISPDITGDAAMMLAAGGHDFPAYDPNVPVNVPVSGLGEALIVPATSSDVLSLLLRTYPSAAVLPLTPSFDHSLIEARAILISSSDVAKNVGATVTIATGAGVTTLKHQPFPFSWPVPSGAGSTARIKATLALTLSQAGQRVSYRVVGIAKGSLSIDGSSWPIRAGGTPAIILGAGNHALDIAGTGRQGDTIGIEYRSEHGPWTSLPQTSIDAPSVPTGGLLGVYYSDPNLLGTPSFFRVDQSINTYYQNPPGSLSFPFSTRWLGTLAAETTGEYEFALDSTGGSDLYVDGRLVLTGGPNGGQRVAEIRLAAGSHAIRVDYRATGSYLHCYLTWAPPGQTSLVSISPAVTTPAHL